MNVAAWQDGAWQFYAPKPGWIAFVASRSEADIWIASAWVPLASVIGALRNLAKLGVLTAADATNRLAVKSDAALFSHDDVTPGTGDMRIAVNKSAAAKDAGFILQDGFSTRVLLGLLGDDDFRVKVSPDGVTFYEALQIDRNSGEVNLRQKRLQAALAVHGGKTEIFCDEELITLSGATTNSTVQIPDGAIVLAVPNRVVTAITGAASYDCSDVGITTRFGGSLGVSVGATNRGLIGPMPYYANTLVLYTAQSRNFTGGQVRMTIHYLKPTWATN